MKYVDEILLGAVQGLTEFLPVSSSGHLVALKQLLNSELAADLSFDVFVHFATLIAVVWVFRSDFYDLVKGLSKGNHRQRALLVAVIVGCIPAGLAGLFLEDWVATLPSHWPHIVSAGWIATAAVLLATRTRATTEEAVQAADTSTSVVEITVRAALWIGVFQAFALLPGVSRSGFTICAALWVGCRRDVAARFSFLCATPLIAGATGLKIVDLVQNGGPPGGTSWSSYIIGGITALVTGYLALLWLLRMLHGGSLHRWAFYLIAAAVGYSSWLFFSHA